MNATAEVTVFGLTILVAVEKAKEEFDKFFGKGRWRYESMKSEAVVTVEGRVLHWQTTAVAYEAHER